MAKRNSRDLDKQAFWQRKLQAQVRSGLSIRAFCRQERLSEPGFYHWRRELARRAAVKSRTAFVPVRVRADSLADAKRAHESVEQEAQATQPGPAGAIEIILAQGYRVRLSGPVDGAALRQVLAVLEGRP